MDSNGERHGRRVDIGRRLRGPVTLPAGGPFRLRGGVVVPTDVTFGLRAGHSGRGLSARSVTLRQVDADFDVDLPMGAFQPRLANVGAV